MVKQLSERLEKKGQKSALIFTSSIAADGPIPGSITYSSSKTFTTYLGEGLYYELLGKVDVLSYRPGNVDTNMNPNNFNGKDFISPSKAASVCLRDLGYESMTYGHRWHENAG